MTTLTQIAWAIVAIFGILFLIHVFFTVKYWVINKYFVFKLKQGARQLRKMEKKHEGTPKGELLKEINDLYDTVLKEIKK